MKSSTTIENTNEPNTPSLPKHATFSSPAPMTMPETPERVPRQLNDLEGTPLLSPPNTSVGNNTNLLLTPQRKKGSSNNANTDFYSLLKSPDVRIDDKKLKRRSAEVFNITNTKSPEQLHRDYDNEHLLKSPRRDYKEIKKISENLKTRLNYANVKVQHGWSRKNIKELEHSLEEIATNPQRAEEINKTLTSNNSKGLDDFWNLKTDNLPNTGEHINPNASSNSNVTPGLLASPGQFSSPVHVNNNSNRRRSSFVSGIKLDEVARRGFKASPELKSLELLPSVSGTSLAHSISNSSSVNNLQYGLQASPLKHDKYTNKLSVNVSENRSSGNKLEQDAIMSLISLSSPVKYTPSGSSLSPSPPQQLGSPTKATQPGLPLLSGIANKRLPPLSNILSNNVPSSAPGIMNTSPTYDKKMSRFVLPSPTKFEGSHQGLGVLSNSSSNHHSRNNSGLSSIQDIIRPNTAIGSNVNETDDETTEDELIEDDEMVITDRNLPEISDGQNSHRFRATRYDDVRMKMTSKKSKA
jgi:hypothetical protein